MLDVLVHVHNSQVPTFVALLRFLPYGLLAKHNWQCISILAPIHQVTMAAPMMRLSPSTCLSNPWPLLTPTLKTSRTRAITTTNWRNMHDSSTTTGQSCSVPRTLWIFWSFERALEVQVSLTVAFCNFWKCRLTVSRRVP